MTQTTTRQTGLARDFSRLKTDGNATVGELREFLGSLRGKSPQEMMGAIAKSDLVRSTCLAAGVCFGVLVVFTLVPWALASEEPQPKAANAAAPAASAATPQPAGNAPAASASTANTGTGAGPAGTQSGEVDLGAAAKALGVDQTKDAPPDKNPLDKNLDTLLDGID